MINLISLSAENYVFYKKASLDLAYTGVTVIRGLNLNVKRGTNNTNAAGKSLLVSAVPQILLSSNAIVTNSRASKKDAFAGNTGTKLTLTYENDGQTVVLSRTAKGLTINVDGKDMTARTQPLVQEQLESMMPLYEDDFFSTSYLDSRRPSLLQIGTAANRHAFIASIVRLQEFDTIKSAINAEIRGLDKMEVEASTLEAELANAQASLPDIGDFSEAKIRYKKGAKEQREFSATLSEVTSHLNSLNTLKLLVERKMEVDTQLKALGIKVSGDDAYAVALKKVKSQQAALEAEKTLVIKHDNYVEQFEAYRTKSKKLRIEIRDLKALLPESMVSLGHEELETQLKSMVQEADNARIELRAATRSKAELEDALSELPVDDLMDNGKDFVPTFDVEDYDQEIANVQATSISLTKSLRHLKGHREGGKCSACRSDLSAKQVQKLVAETATELKQANEHLEALRTEQATIARQLDARKTAKERTRLNKELAAVNEKLARLEKGQKKSDTSTLSKYVDALFKLSMLNKPKWDKEVPTATSDELQEQIDQLGSVVSTLTSTMRLENDLDEAASHIDQNTDLDNLQETLTKKREALTEKVNKHHKELTKLRANLQEYLRTRKRIRDLEKRVAELRLTIKDLPIYKMLHAAYSNNGLKTLVMQRLLERIQENMNTYSPLLFPEKVSFELSVGGSSKFDILVTRKEGKKEVVSDVRSLSGAESRAFSLLTLLSLLPFIPSSRRLNVLVLDEMTSNMDAVRKELFIAEFLPALQLVVPHIIIVTPEEDHYPDARVFYAVKKGSESRLLTEQAAYALRQTSR